jgi:hypothetical protein
VADPPAGVGDVSLVEIKGEDAQTKAVSKPEASDDTQV